MKTLIETRPKVTVAILLLLALPAVVQAQFSYTTNNGTITITEYTGPSGAVTIPAIITGLPVTSIGDYAFYQSGSLTNVTIPDSVTSIGEGAFNGCYFLTIATIGNSLTSIGSNAFASCYRLTSVTIPNGVTNIEGGAFAACHSLASVTIPNSVTSIGNGAFFLCTSLTNITIPNSVNSIGDHVFAYCTSLASITIPNSVTNIEGGAFSQCYSLAAITVHASNPAYSSMDGVLFNKNHSALIQYPAGKAESQYTTPDSVTSIGNGAFSYCYLNSVTIPNSVTSIGDQAFYECLSLANILIGNSVTSIGIYAFSFSILASVTIPKSVTSIADRALYGCDSLTAITVDALNPTYSSTAGVLFNKNQTELIQYPGGKAGSFTVPNSVTNIRDSAFHDCYGLTNIVIGNSVTSLEDRAFEGCYNLATVTIGNGVILIGNYAFASCTSLSSVYFSCNAPSLGDSASPVFFGTTNATVYYLPGTTGWGATFGNRPTAYWHLPAPVLLSFGPSFGIQSNLFGFIISWATNIPVVVEASTTLVNPTWTPVSTNTLNSGSSHFSDSLWTNYPSRFYRLRSP